MAVTTERSAGATAIRPFRVEIPQAEVDELRRRIAATRWPEKETVDDGSQGTPLAKLQELVRYWGTDYDCRRFEARLNALPQFVTSLDGLDIHFIHVRSPHPDALPLIMTHGWPGSIVELLNDHRPAHRPDRAWRARRRRVRSGAAVDARLRLLGEADVGGLEPRSHRASLGGAGRLAWDIRAMSPKAVTGGRSSPRRWDDRPQPDS